MKVLFRSAFYPSYSEPAVTFMVALAAGLVSDAFGAEVLPLGAFSTGFGYYAGGFGTGLAGAGAGEAFAGPFFPLPFPFLPAFKAFF